MSCSLLNTYYSFSWEKLIEKMSSKFEPEALERHVAHHTEQYPRNFQRKLAELLYYQEGSDLAAREDWGKMTSLQLEHEARVKGLLGYQEPNHLPDYFLRWQLEEDEYLGKSDRQDC